MYYQVQVSTNSSFNDLVVNKIVEDVTDYTIVKDLEPFAVYYWRVKAIDPITGAKSAWSTPCTFRIKASDIIIEHDIDSPTVDNSYIWYYGLVHKFVRSYDTECVIPNAQIGVGLSDPIEAQIGQNYCPGVCVPQFDGIYIEVLFTESHDVICTEDGIPLLLDF